MLNNTNLSRSGGFGNDKFYINAPNDLPNGMKFTLIETISATQLIVMELLEKDGRRLTPYETPIVYDRVK